MTGLIPWRRERGDLGRLRSEMDRLFDRFFDVSPFGDTLADGEWIPAVDVSENDKEVTVKVELPGMDPKDIDISADSRYLHIQGEKKDEREEKDRNFYKVERSYGSFSRSIELPSEVNSDKVEAKYKDGMLNISLPKTEQQSRKKIQVKSS